MRYLLSFLLVFSIPSLALSQENVQSTEIQKGEKAPYDGVLIPKDDAEFLFAATERMQTELKIYENMFPQMKDTLDKSIKTIKARNKTQKNFNNRPTQGQLVNTAINTGIAGTIFGSAITTIAYLLIN